LETPTLRGLCVRYSRWFDPNCGGQEIRGVCNFGVADLDNIRSSGCFIANKFNFGVSYEAAICQAAEVAKETALEAANFPPALDSPIQTSFGSSQASAVTNV